MSSAGVALIFQIGWVEQRIQKAKNNNETNSVKETLWYKTMVSPRNSTRNTRSSQLVVFSGGILFGFFLSSMIFLFSSSLENSCGKSLKFIPNPSTAIESIKNSVPDSLNLDQGWKLIHVFYGSSSHIADFSAIPTPYFQANQWFSQYRQDELVSKLLHGKRNGYFVDLASNDAIRISNTYSLETFFDWNGICLEPNAVYWRGLSYRKCHVAAAVIGNNTMDQIDFTFPKDKAPKGGIVGNKYDNKRAKSNEIKRQYSITLMDIFQKFQAPKIIDYLSLDVEGAEDLVMAAFPFSEYQFNILTVERPSESLSQILSSNGYMLLKTLKVGKETLWIHNSIHDALDLTALEIDSQNYKYRENNGNRRIAPEDERKVVSQTE